VEVAEYLTDYFNPRIILQMQASNALLAIVPLLPSVYLSSQLRDVDTRNQLFKSALIGCAAFMLTQYLVPIVAEYTKKKGLSGKDLCKRGLTADEKDMYIFCMVNL
jgi:hypothetical protein